MQERSSYLLRIDEALGKRDEVAAMVAEGLQEAQGKVDSRARKALGKFRNASSAETLLQDVDLARFLPLLMGHARQDSTQMEQGLKRIVDEEQAGFRSNRFFNAYIFVPLLLFTVILYFQANLLTPIFEEMFKEFGMRKPKSTQWLFAVNGFVRAYGVLCIVLLIVLVFGLGLIKRLISTCIGYLQRFRAIEVLTSGRKVDLYAMSRLTASFAELLELEAPIDDAIRFAGLASGHPFYKRYSAHIGESSLTRSSFDSTATRFPAVLRGALQADQASRNESLFLRDLSSVYTDRALLRTQHFNNVFAPWGIVMIGIAVVFVVLNLFMPLTSLITALS